MAIIRNGVICRRTSGTRYRKAAVKYNDFKNYRNWYLGKKEITMCISLPPEYWGKRIRFIVTMVDEAQDETH